MRSDKDKSEMQRARKRRSLKGQAIIEAVCAAMVLVPLAMAMLDFMVIVIANSNNDSCAKTAARAASNQADEATALAAVNKVVDAARKSFIVSGVAFVLQGFNYDSSAGKVTVMTRINVRLPVPFPGISDFTFQAKAIEPIVNFNAPN